MPESPKGFIYRIRRFAIHDGPGIRTLVQMKGCPLSCLWCSTPESQKATKDILHSDFLCRRCKHCIAVCPVQAIVFSEVKGIQIDGQLCTHCGECVNGCPGQALEIVGSHLTVEHVFEEINKDAAFYRRSNGGVTVGGGEPMMQHVFVTALLKKCKDRYINTALETCGYVKWDHLAKVLEFVDLLYYDIKHMDTIKHKSLTGIPNKLILENAKKAAPIRPMVIRIPVIPTCNDSDENIAATAKFAAELGENIKRIELLPYHQFGTITYERLGWEYKLNDIEPPGDSNMEKLRDIVESYGVKVQIGG